jgi:hypothetical protein
MRAMIGGEAELPRLQSPGVTLVIRGAQGIRDGEGGLGREGRLGAGE